MDEDSYSIKKLKEEINMTYYVADAEYGIHDHCPCGAMIKDEVAPQESRDFHPGKIFFTCSKYKIEGLHFRQPWVLGVKEEIQKLTKRIEYLESTIRELLQLRVEVHKVSMRVAELERGD